MENDFALLMEGAIKEDFMNELDEVSEQLKNLATETPEKEPPKKHSSANLPSFMPSSPFLSITILFLLVFFLLIQMPAELYRTIALLSLLVASLAGIQQVALIVRNHKRTGFEMIVGLVLIFMLAVSYFFAWDFIAKYFWPIMIFFGIILVLGTVFFLLHAYMAYLRRFASFETGITSLIMAGTWIVFLATVLEQSMIYFLLFIVLFILFGKASIDFSERFREKK